MFWWAAQKRSGSKRQSRSFIKTKDLRLKGNAVCYTLFTSLICPIKTDECETRISTKFGLKKGHHKHCRQWGSLSGILVNICSRRRSFGWKGERFEHFRLYRDRRPLFGSLMWAIARGVERSRSRPDNNVMQCADGPQHGNEIDRAYTATKSD